MLSYIKTKLTRARLKKSDQVSVFGHKIYDFNFTRDGVIQYAQWLHPNEGAKSFSQAAVDAYRHYIKPGDLVIDIGAHTGDSTLPYALAAGPEGLVLAFEPNPYVFKILEANAALNKAKTNVLPLNFAATERDEELEFLYSDNGYCNGGNLNVIENKKHRHNFKLKVQGKNLTNYLQTQHSDRLSKLSFIKTDTEGYDLYVLKSLEEIIKKYRPVLISEVLRKLVQRERKDLLDFFTSHNYQVFKLDLDASSLLGPPINYENLLEWNHYDVICLP